MTSPGGKVEISKTIAPTGEENLFDITLTVKTEQEINHTTTSPDAAVVLALDVSGSMGYCADCGSERGTEEHCANCGEKKRDHDSLWGTYYCDVHSGNTYEKCSSTQTRLDAAKATAAQFLQKFAASAAGAQRQVAVVTFSSGASAMSFGHNTYWLDVAKGNNLTTVVDEINDLSAEGGTNMDGGLRVAYTLLTQSAIASINYRNVILLTDGEPTYCVNDSGFNSNNAKLSYGGSTSGYGQPKEVHGDGSTACEKTVSYVETVARAIRGLYTDTKLYSVYYGGAGDTMNVYTDYKSGNHYEGYYAERDMNIADWLGSVSSRDAFTAANADELNASFDAIIKIIEMQTKAWTVTDEMGDRIQFVSGAVVNGDNQAKIYDTESSSIVWRLPLDVPQMEGDWHVYTMTYRVRLNNVGTDFDTEKYYLTNGETKLEYSFFKTQNINGVEQQGPTDESGNFVYNEDGTVRPGMEKWTENQVLYFKVPAVKGYQAKLSFTKIAGDTNAALANAQFTLTPSSAGSVSYSGSDTSDGSGEVEFANIPSGYTYTLKEMAAPEDYNPVADITVTVKYGVITTASTASDGANITDGKLVDPAKQTYRDVTITKTWRKPATETTPDSITVTLKQDGVDYRTVTLTPGENGCSAQGNTWTYTFYNLPDSNPAGGYHVYTVEEAAVDGYTATYGKDGLSITNTASGTTSVVVAKFWTLPEGMSPANQTVEVTLTQNGEEMTGTEYTKTITGNGRVKFENLPKYDENGKLYKYGAVEAEGNYQQAKPTTSDGYTITFYNTVADETTTISGVKTWNDDGDTASRPASIAVTLYKDGEATAQTATASAETNWTYSFENLSRYEFTRDGDNNIIAVREIEYTVKETAVDGYKSTVTGNNITNTRTGTVDLTVNKVWVSQEDHPADVTVQLYANGVASGDPVTFEDSHTFTGLDKYDAQGKLITYSVTESPVEGHTPSYSTLTTDSEGNCQITITNTQSGADDTVKVTVTKTWQQPGTVEEQKATFALYANGVATGKTVEITGNDSAAFEDLPRYTETHVEGGDTLLEEITYTVQENVPNGYTSTSEQVGPDSNGDVYFHFTNTITGTTSVSVEKSWVKPADVTAPAVTFTVQRSVDSLTWEDAETITLVSGEASVEAENLDKYNENGQQYIYQIKEVSVPGYSSSMTGGMLEDGTYSYQVTNTINQAYADISVSKTWIDGNTPDSERPSVTLDLLQDGIAVASVTFAYDAAEGKVMATVTKDGVTSEPVAASVSGNTWSTTVNMPLYNAAGTAKYVYTASEAQVPEGYRATATGTNVTNKRSGSIDIDITKYWVDPGSTTNRPEITLTLTGSDENSYPVVVTQNGEDVTASLNGESLTTIVSGSTWTITVPNLPEYTDTGVKIAYTLSESPVSGYTSETVEGQPFAIKNTIQQVSDAGITPVKVWANMDVQGVYTPVLPETISVALFRDGVKVEGSERTVAVGEDGSCTFESYENLERYDLTTGQYYNYEVLELDASGNPVKDNGTISFGTDNDYAVTYEMEGSTVTITNTFKVPAKYLWMIKTHYIHYDYNGNQIANYSNQSEVFAETDSKIVTANPSDYTLCSYDNLSYTFDADNAGNKTEATLIHQNYLYVLELYYELTDAEPVTPPIDPGPGPGPGTTTYTITVNYYNQDGDKIAESHRESHNSGTQYDVSAYDAIAIEGYTYVETTGDAVSGILNSNKVIDVYYTNEADIDDGDTPLNPNPDDGGEIDIDDGETPMGDGSGLDDGTEIIDENETPLGNLPQTGAAEAVNPFATAGFMALAASMAAAGLVLTRTKSGKREED